MTVALYFGTFNPIHVGHLIIANHMVDYTEVDQVWFVVTPHNPHKEKKTLLKDFHRLNLVKEAIDDNFNFRASDIEFGLPQPNYTINTLVALNEKYPDYEFRLIMGEDNLRSFQKWKNYEKILEGYHIHVYPRPYTNAELKAPPEDLSSAIANHPHIHFEDAPVMRVSSSFIRNAIKSGKDVRYLLTEPVFKYIDEMGFYKS